MHSYNGNAVVTWESVAGKMYVVESTDTLPGTFTALSATNMASAASTSYTNTTGIAARFYRVKLVP